ncbi:uncharacterized protein G2W53_004667 [Senna tora]|uniref:Uncharacterized protein n=1 Tax=Senna tora TaxID=362788 RepID=A0A835CHF7_9FABA|nr:uncharacterized protein G2W53_004667 [Senna tora]
MGGRRGERKLGIPIPVPSTGERRLKRVRAQGDEIEREERLTNLHEVANSCARGSGSGAGSMGWNLDSDGWLSAVHSGTVRVERDRWSQERFSEEEFKVLRYETRFSVLEEFKVGAEGGDAEGMRLR